MTILTISPVLTTFFLVILTFFLQCWQLFTMLTNFDKFGGLGQTQPNPKVMWNILQLTFICVMNFAFILFPTESPLVKLGQFWPLLPSPGWTKCYLIAKSSLQHSIFMKSQKIGNLFFEHFTGCIPTPPPPRSDRTNSVR